MVLRLHSHRNGIDAQGNLAISKRKKNATLFYVSNAMHGETAPKYAKIRDLKKGDQVQGSKGKLEQSVMRQQLQRIELKMQEKVWNAQ